MSIPKKHQKLKLLFVMGTRPEAIKLAPLIQRAKKDPRFTPVICLTGQHRQMTDQVMSLFKMKADFDLNLMTKNQTLGDIAQRVLSRIKTVFNKSRPDLVLVQGDTTTAFSAALAASYQKIKVAHVEAGLRSFDKNNPFPEETNRVLISRIADFHFAPTTQAKTNLLSEGISSQNIWVTGNTIVDALESLKPLVNRQHWLPIRENLLANRKLVLVTAHRRESFGKPLLSICHAIKDLSEKFPDLLFVIPVHPNPSVQSVIRRELSTLSSILLIAPVSYIQCLSLISTSHFILTDSGGVQEEAPSFHKPVLVLRNKTERPEGIAAGVAKLVGTSKTKIISEVSKLLSNGKRYKKMTSLSNPYGDGRASQKILNILAKAI